jgi:uncharacterized protein YbaR (Trm112 family)
MVLTDIELLNCVDCQGDLSVVDVKLENNEIVHGLVKCDSCSRHYPIINHVGIFFRKDKMKLFLKPFEIKTIHELGYQVSIFELHENANQPPDLVVQGSLNWEYQWSDEFLALKKEILEQDNYYGIDMFKRFIPINFEGLIDKSVLIAGPGRGREVYHVSKYHPRKIFVVEIGASIYSIVNCLPESGNLLVLLRSDMTCHPVKPGQADVSICDHALQHVLDHQKAFSKLIETTKNKGLVAVCVYGYENNFIMTSIVEPLKKILHMFTMRTQKVVSFFPALILYFVINVIYIPLNMISKKLITKLPLNEQLMCWSANSFKMIWVMCFDLLHAPISYHFKKQEVENLSKKNKLVTIKLINTQGTTWSLVAEKRVD